jgi:hypothetical protein
MDGLAHRAAPALIMTFFPSIAAPAELTLQAWQITVSSRIFGRFAS